MMPPGVGTPHGGPFATGLGEILEFELRGPGYTPMQLYQMLQWQIVPQLRLVPGIADVNIYGGELQTYEVQVSPERLRRRASALPEVFAAIEANNAARGGAYIEHGDEQEIVRGLALAQSQADIASIVLKTAPGGVPVTVGDVAEVRMAPKVRLGAVTHDGEGETIARRRRHAVRAERQRGAAAAEGEDRGGAEDAAAGRARSTCSTTAPT